MSIYRISLLAITLLLAACDDNDSDPVGPATASALPAIASGSQFTVTENTTAAADIDATISDSTTLTYQLVDGDDIDLFSIDSSTGEVTFSVSPDFEAPLDTNADNDYELVVEVRSPGGSVEQAITVSVTDVAPLTAEEIQEGTALVDKVTGDLSTNFAFSPLKEYSGIAAGTTVNAGRVFISADCNDGESETSLPSVSLDGYHQLVSPACELDELGSLQNLLDSLGPWPVLTTDVDNIEGTTGTALRVEVNARSATSLICDDITFQLNDEDGFSYTFGPGFFTAGETRLDCLLTSDSGINPVTLTVVSSPPFVANSDDDASDDGENEEENEEDDIEIDPDNTPPALTLAFPPVFGLFDGNSINIRGAYTDVNGDAALVNVEAGMGEFAATVDGDNQTWDGGLTTPATIEQQIEISVTGSDATTSADTNSITATLSNRTYFYSPRLFAYDETNSRLIFTDYIAEADGVGIFEYVESSGLINLLTRTEQVSFEEDMLWDPVGERLLVSNSSLDDIDDIDLVTGNRIEVSGDTVGTGAAFSNPTGMAINSAGTILYVGDSISNDADAIVTVDLATGNRTIVSDSDTGSGREISTINFLALDEVNNRLLVTDVGAEDSVVSVDLTTGDRTVIADQSGTGSGPVLQLPQEIAYNANDNSAYVADQGSLYAIDLADNSRSLVVAAVVDSFDIGDLLFDATLDRILVASGLNGDSGVSSVNPDTLTVSRIYDGRIGAGPRMVSPFDVIPDIDDNRIFIIEGDSTILEMNLTNGARKLLSDASDGPDQTQGILYGIMNAAGDALLTVSAGFNVDEPSLVEVDLATGTRTFISGNGVGTGDDFGEPDDVALDAANNRVFVSDFDLNVIWTVDLATGNRSVLTDNTFAGDVDVSGIQSLAYDADSERLFYVEWTNGMVEVDLGTGYRTLLSGDDGEGLVEGTGDDFESPQDMVLDTSNDRIIVNDWGFGDSETARLVAVDLTTGDRTVLSNFENGNGPNLQLPFGIGFDEVNQRAWIADFNLNAIVTIDTSNGDRVISAF